MTSVSGNDWQGGAEEYGGLIHTEEPEFLRQNYLYPTLARMVQESGGSVVADIGCGDGSFWKWFQKNQEYNLFGCDIVLDFAKTFDRGSVCNAASLSFKSSVFDTAVYSLSIMWLPNVFEACLEANRVLKKGGHIVISLVSPYFYRTGHVNDKDQFMITRDLSSSFKLEDLRITNKVGPFIYYFRPLHEYLNTLIRAGFEVKEVQETFIDMAEYQSAVSAESRAFRRSGKVPIYSFVHCIKL